MNEQGLESIAVIGDEETCTGFRLAGVKTVFALKGTDASKKLEEIVDAGLAGVVIINEKIVPELDWRLRKKMERIAKPVIIAVPDKGGPSAEVESLKSMIAKALGFELLK